MGLSSKFLLLLFVCIAFQTMHAFPQFNIFRWKNLGYEINKAADDSERDVRKDLLNVKNKAWKDTSKMINKFGGSELMLKCMMEAHQNFISNMDSRALEAITCVEEVRTAVKGIEEEKLSPGQMGLMKSEFKSRVKSCRNDFKDDLKKYQRDFSSTGVLCHSNHYNPSN